MELSSLWSRRSLREGEEWCHQPGRATCSRDHKAPEEGLASSPATLCADLAPRPRVIPLCSCLYSHFSLIGVSGSVEDRKEAWLHLLSSLPPGDTGHNEPGSFSGLCAPSAYKAAHCLKDLRSRAPRGATLLLCQVDKARLVRPGTLPRVLFRDAPSYPGCAETTCEQQRHSVLMLPKHFLKPVSLHTPQMGALNLTEQSEEHWVDGLDVSLGST